MRSYCKVDHTNGTKRCPDCGGVKPLTEFSVRKSGYVYSYCKACSSRKAGVWSIENRERKTAHERERVAQNPVRETQRRRNAHYMRRFGMSYADINVLLEKQGFMCAICGDGVSWETLVVDHCHTNGDVRGVLCNLCNITLGPVERGELGGEKPSVVERRGIADKAIAYVERHRSGS